MGRNVDPNSLVRDCVAIVYLGSWAYSIDIGGHMGSWASSIDIGGHMGSWASLLTMGGIWARGRLY